jgi:hypothetical protein
MGTDGSAQRALRKPPAGASVADWQPNVDLTLIAQRRPRARGRRTAGVLFAIVNTSPTETGRVRLRVRVGRSVRVTETSRRCAPSRTINCALGALSPGGVARVPMSLRPRRCGTFSVSASVTSLKPDPRPGNNRARVRLRARC